MRYLKTFENHNNYEDFTETEAFVKPNVSYCIQLNEVHYNPWTDPRLIVKYNITDISEPVKLYNYAIKKEGKIMASGAMMFDKIEIDDGDVSITSVDTAQGTYQFATAGEHTVKYTLKDPTFIGTEYDGQTDTIKIGAWFYGCETAIAIEIPNSVTTIGDQAFQGCTGLTSVIIPNSVTTIGDQAFQGCTGLTSVIIPNSVTSIGNYAFYRCSGLTFVTIGNSVTSIGSRAFASCRGLTSIICNATTAPTITSYTFIDVKTNGTLTVPTGSTGYDVWMGTGNFYLGKYGWTKVEQ